MKKFLKLLKRNHDFFIAFVFVSLSLHFFSLETEIDMWNKHTVLVSVGTLLLWFSLPFLFKKREKRILLLTSTFLATFIIYADLVYYRYFGDFITTPALTQINQAGDVSSSVFELLKISDVIYFAGFFVLLIIYSFSLKESTREEMKLSGRVTIFAMVVILGATLVVLPMKQYTNVHGTGLLKNLWINEPVVIATGQLGFHVFETQKYARDVIFGKPKISEVEKISTLQVFDEANVPSNPEWFGVEKGSNVMVIQLESFQNFLLNKKINGQEITPNLNELVKETLYFDNFYHQTGHGRTSDAEFLVNTSLYPLSGGSAYIRYPTNDYDSIPGILKNENYHTIAYHAHFETFWNRAGMYRNYGFDDFLGKEDLFSRTEVQGLYSNFQTMGDEQLFLESLKDININKPFYRFVVALTSHHPYSDIPTEASNLNVAPFEDDIFGHYLKSINYVDRAVGTFVEKMKKEGLWEDTIVLFYGDHDNGLEWKSEHALSINSNFTEMKSTHTLKNVPLIIHSPNSEMKGTKSHTVGMVDIAPSLLELLGIEGEYAHLGSSVFDMEDHVVPFRNGWAIKGELIYKTSTHDGQCYNKYTETASGDSCSDLGEKARIDVQASDNMIYHNLNKD